MLRGEFSFHFSAHNIPSFRACSQILASLSSYPYTRRAWRKEAFELLLDPGIFQMDEVCSGFWKIIIDNLMTHDKTTFKDLLGMLAMSSFYTILSTNNVWKLAFENPLEMDAPLLLKSFL